MSVPDKESFDGALQQLKKVEEAIHRGDLADAKLAVSALMPLLVDHRAEEVLHLKSKVDALKASVANTHLSLGKKLNAVRKKRHSAGAYQSIARKTH